MKKSSHYVGVMYLGRIVEYGKRSKVFLNPQHAYTKALLKAVPIADPRKRKDESDLRCPSLMSSPIHEVGYEASKVQEYTMVEEMATIC